MMIVMIKQNYKYPALSFPLGLFNRSVLVISGETLFQA